MPEDSVALTSSEDAGYTVGHEPLPAKRRARSGRPEDGTRQPDEYDRSLLRLYKELGCADTYGAIVRALRPAMQEILGYQSIWLLLLRGEGDAQELLLLDAGGPVEEAAKAMMSMDERYRTTMHGEECLIMPLTDDPFMTALAGITDVWVVEDCRTHPLPNKAVVERTGNRTCVDVPLALADKKIGVLCTGTFGDEEGVRLPTDRQLDYLRSLANHVSVATDRVRFLAERREAEEALERTVAEVEAILSGVVQALASTTGQRDPYTAHHQQRVARLACAIAERMGLSEDQIDGLRIAAVLHDIGKVSIPVEILIKPSILGVNELGLIRHHPTVGRQLLEDIPFHGPVGTIVAQHHERLDGSGYPSGLHSDELLIESKILAVADVVEAMASDRPYRPAIGIDAALAEVKKGAGKTFDTDVVEACVALFDADPPFSL